MTRSPARRHDCRAVVAWLAAGMVVSQLVWAVTLEQWRPEPQRSRIRHKLPPPPPADRLRSGSAAAPGPGQLADAQRPAANVLAADGPRVFNFGLTRHGAVAAVARVRPLAPRRRPPRGVTIELFPVALAQGADE